MITAHSGCEETPDNSIASIETAVRLGADCVEIDLRADGDGGLFLTHDMPDSFSGLVSLETAFEAIRRGGIAVNRDLNDEIELNCDIGSFSGYRVLSHTVLESDDLKAVNGPGRQNVSPKQQEGTVADGRSLTARLHRASWNVIRLKEV